MNELSLEERWNFLTHAFGLLLSCLGAVLMVAFAELSGDLWKVASAAIFGGSLIFLYMASTLYHKALSEEEKRRYKVMDHCAIYCLIAGSYTPFALITLRDGIGGIVFAGIWSIALLGVLFKLYYTGKFRLLSTILYLGMGWVSMIIYEPMAQNLPKEALAWILAGGLAYTFGAFIYLAKRPRFHHAIWHLFVMAGSTCHYLTVLIYVI
jgi:hemolysin III